MLKDLDEIVILEILQKRFDENMQRHPQLKWIDIEKQLIAQPLKLKTLFKCKEQAVNQILQC